ncbi:hypothetical protein C8R47DRAFT_1074100 [Mycena vitilis]|nr:hypothetical protein C8R47DRAFT_1074100 [Mycena vitilis]
MSPPNVSRRTTRRKRSLKPMLHPSPAPPSLAEQRAVHRALVLARNPGPKSATEPRVFHWDPKFEALLDDLKEDVLSPPPAAEDASMFAQVSISERLDFGFVDEDDIAEEGVFLPDRDVIVIERTSPLTASDAEKHWSVIEYILSNPPGYRRLTPLELRANWDVAPHKQGGMRELGWLLDKVEVETH